VPVLLLSVVACALSLRACRRDLPWRGTPVKIRFITRRFFCDHPVCHLKIFSEQMRELAKHRAQSTPRPNQDLNNIGLEASGAPGARWAPKLGTVTSRPSVLRRLRSLPPVPQPETTVAARPTQLSGWITCRAD